VITGWNVENFKSIRSSEITLSNLNVLMGANSVGKSSLIQSMVALAQLVGEERLAETVQLIGNSQDLGSAGSVLHRYPGKLKSGRVVIGAEGRTNNGPNFKYSIGLELSTTRANDFTVASETLESGTDNNFTKITTRFLESKSGNSIEGRSITAKFGEIEFEDVARLSSNSTNGIFPEISPASWFETFLRIAFDHQSTRLVSRSPNDRNPESRLRGKGTRGPLGLGFYASKLDELGLQSPSQEEIVELKKYQEIQSSSDGGGAGLQRFAQTTHVKIDDSRLDRLMRALSQQRLTSSPPNFEAPEIFNDQVFRALKFGERDMALRKIGSSFIHLGPIRVVSPSQQQNRRSPSMISPLGTSGEFLAYTLSIRGAEESEFPMPDGSVKLCPLAEALNAWIGFLGLEGRIRTDFVEGLTTRITLGNRMFSQLGSGVSQVLPVITLCLLAANKRSTLAIIEQPELHLHPNLQRKMADMFAVMAANGVRLLIETHSEYLVTRLRLLLAKGQLDPSHVSLIFAEQKGSGRYGKYADIRQANMTETGDSDYWPEGFHSESLRDRFELSALQLMRFED
jgi:hypothetical protein